jgi:hypothetical protein
VAGSRERSNKHSGSIRVGEFFDHLGSTSALVWRVKQEEITQCLKTGGYTKGLPTMQHARRQRSVRAGPPVHSEQTAGHTATGQESRGVHTQQSRLHVSDTFELSS